MKKTVFLFLVFICWWNPDSWGQSNGEYTKSSEVLRLSALPDTILYLEDYAQILVDSHRTVDLTEAQNLWTEGAFQPLKNLVYPAKFVSGFYHYWLRLEIDNYSSDTLLAVVRMPRLDSNFLYQYVDDRPVQELLFGNKIKLDRTHMLSMGIDDRSAASVRLLPNRRNVFFIRTSDNLYLTSKIGPTLHSRYGNLKRAFSPMVRIALLDGMLMGVLLFLLVFSLLHFMLHRDRAFLFYAVYVGFTFLYNWILFDYANGSVRFLSNWLADYNYIKIPIDVGMIIGYLLFVQYFLNEQNQFPAFTRQIRLFLAITTAYLVFSIGLSLVNVRYSWIFHYYFIVFVIGMSLVVLYHIWRMQTRLSLYIFGGMLVLLILALAVSIPFRLGYFKNVIGRIKDLDLLLRQLGIFAELIFFTLGLAQKRILAEEERRIAEAERQQLAQLETFKSRFYTNIAHEFRTPLTSILGMTERLEQTDAEPTALQIIRRNGQRILNLINDMLNLAKTQNGQIRLHYVHQDVISFVRYLSEPFRAMAEEKKISWRWTTSLDALPMDVDEEKLTIILSNLLGNAMKFTPAGGQVELSLDHRWEDDRRFLQIAVRDTGPGIPTADQPAVFDPYFQTKNNQFGLSEGTGIGLALTRNLIEQLSGTIRVESTENLGTTFTVTLPVTHQSAPKKAPVEPPEVKPDGLAAPTLSEADLPTVLLLEDDPDVAHYLTVCLQEDYCVLHVADGLQGLQRAFATLPDMIISDIRMPGLDGLEVCRRLKDDVRTNHIPVILLTARADASARLRGLSQGADAYLTKPFSRDELIIRLRRLQALRATLQRKYSRGLISASPVPSETTHPAHEFVQKIEAIMLTHLHDETFSVHDLAREVHLSRSQLHRKVKSLTGMATTHYIRFVRLERAKELLLTQTLSVSEVAYRVGFKTPVYFSQVFKKAYGCSPSEAAERLVPPYGHTSPKTEI